jgi:hypothetical protein
MQRKIEPIPMSIGKVCKKTPYAVKLARMPTKTALAETVVVLVVTAVAMVVTAAAMAVVEAVLVAATLVVAFGANPYRKNISI